MFSINYEALFELNTEDVAIRNMLKCADDALYEVKGKGKNAIHITRVMGM